MVLAAFLPKSIREKLGLQRKALLPVEVWASVGGFVFSGIGRDA